VTYQIASPPTILDVRPERPPATPGCKRTIGDVVQAPHGRAHRRALLRGHAGHCACGARVGAHAARGRAWSVRRRPLAVLVPALGALLHPREALGGSDAERDALWEGLDDAAELGEGALGDGG